MIKSLVLIGGGGHCRSCIDVVESAGLAIKGIVDNDPAGEATGYGLLGGDEMLEQLVHEYQFLVTIGFIKNAKPRVRLFEKLLQLKAAIATVVSPHAISARNSSAGRGTIVMHHAVLNFGASVGDNCIINTKALIEHDSQVGDHSHISTGTVINGDCVIGKKVFIGSNAVIAQGVRIADNVIIGAGAVVLKDIEDAGVYAGNPAGKI